LRCALAAICLCSRASYEFGFGAGFVAAACFAAGLETPMLISRKASPFRSSSSSRMCCLPVPSVDGNARCASYFLAGGSVTAGAGAAVCPFKTATAAGGSGLSAFASSTLTCHISVSLSSSLYDGMPVSRIPLATFQ
jgi:hypothetical protein